MDGKERLLAGVPGDLCPYLPATSSGELVV